MNKKTLYTLLIMDNYDKRRSHMKLDLRIKTTTEFITLNSVSKTIDVPCQ